MSKSPKAAATGTITAAIESTLDTMEAANTKLHALTQITRESALAEAHLADARVAAGAAHGLLHGMPVGIKDIADVEGLVSGCGSLTRKQAEPARKDAHVVTKLRTAGAIIAGKTHTVEYAFGGYGTNVTVGTPWNPWDLKVHRIPGGSSSGTGSMVGAGVLPGGLGTDTGGSVRIPAALCGCVGLKTSIGLIGRSGIAPLSQTLDTAGPLAHDVTTAARMFAAMLGHDPEDPSTEDFRPIDPLRDLEKGVAGLRIGRIVDEDLTLTTEEVRADIAQSASTLEKLGARIEPFKMPQSFESFTRATGIIIASEGYANWRKLIDDPKSGMADPIRTRFLGGKTISAADYLDVIQERGKAIDAFLSAMDRLDALILPTIPFPAIAVAEVDETKSPMAHFTRWANYLALASLAIPTALSKSKLPMSLQIVVRRFDDALALRIGRAFEKARGDFPAPKI
ncbi:amidase [Hyphomicrobium sp. CS1BSMeth3]|uniref:amidase n=1 Tax=Hyphomicrobium sp. CS1BSMeth3 TaxID=1892844 RepID=UPI00093102E7|nr:amidase [Hyphomicrobium sp. CS1BSMeth3]